MMDVLTHGEFRARPVPSFPDEAQLIAAIAADCLLKELETWPKPGLVSHVDRGSHQDMDADMFRASVNAIKPYFQELAEAGASGCKMPRLRTVGLDAEAAMLAATSGTNTHRGAIFGLGLLCAAAGVKSRNWGDPDVSLGTEVVRFWGRSIFEGTVPPNSHGGRARRRFGAGGARMEAALGFPSIYNCGLPALERARLKAPDEAEAQRVETCFALIATVEDTNLLHRGGYEGLDFARSAALGFLQSGGVGRRGWRQRAQSVHNSFVARRLSPGGSADLLAMTLFVDAFEKASR